MPEKLLERLLAARTFNQGFATVEYVSSAYADFDFHARPDVPPVDAGSVEKETLARIGMPAAIAMRHRPAHFAHIFAGGYSAGYYSYLWSEVLDADGFAAFEEAGDIFDGGIARRLHDYVYAAGYLRDPGEAYLAFRGRMPDAQALLAKRGLAEAPAAAGEM
jgi:peptidyl-dipeptidase Dcp